ncbi:hypothetical protein F4821DRAFT_274522 [Hypoxylon rubiginosum]|uniref:Uncharacterized protein n=1 Tax=Hypoxylon rubiginosum TaxID=110542 RepID=A0ACC0CNJ1_9PEZI|nr:hypothetical protein F4821DRAFT_274522 [Hypoxylon rubiginosum]
MEWTAEQRYSTYKQYKEDTEAIAGWLDHHSRKCGLKLGKTSKPKSKARKLKSKTKSAADQAHKYAVNVSDFNLMAKTIAESKHKVDVPRALTNLFSRAINARNEFTEWYRESPNGDEESNKRHAHFTGVLNSTWRILCPSKPAEESQLKKQPTAVPELKTAANLVNRFSELKVEQPQEGVDTNTSPSAAQDKKEYKLTGIVPATIIKTEEENEEEFLFAIFTFMQEVANVRVYVKNLWESYRVGKLDLIACSLLTNTAIQLIRREEHQLSLLLQRPKKYPEPRYYSGNFPDIFIYATCERSLKVAGVNLDDFIRPSRICLVDTSYFTTLCMTDTFGALKTLVRENKEMAVADHYVFAEHQQSEDMPETYNRVADIVNCFYSITQAIGETYARDEITSAVDFVMESSTVPIWAAYATQVLLDIQDALKGTPNKALYEVQRRAQRKIAGIRGQTLNQEPFSAVAEGNQWLIATLGGYEQDVLGDYYRKTFLENLSYEDRSGNLISEVEMSTRLPHHMVEPDYFLRINPVKCGLLKYGIYLHLHAYATNIENGWHGITSTMHLYVACRSMFPDDPVWPDMEYFLEHQDLGNLFFGGLPRSMTEAHTKARLATGESLASITRSRSGRNTRAPELNPDKARYISSPCPLLSDVFTGWMWGSETAADDMVTKLVSATQGPTAATDKKAPKAKAKSPEPDYSKLSILDKLKSKITCETDDLYFDWISFMETCQCIWEQIHRAVKLQTDKGYKAGLGPLIQILEEAAVSETMAKNKKLDPRSVLAERARGLNCAWKIIQKVNRLPLKGPAEGGDSTRTDEKIWGGDKEISNVVSKAEMGMSLVRKIYKNWPEEDVDLSATTHKNLADRPGEDREAKRGQ